MKTPTSPADTGQKRGAKKKGKSKGSEAKDDGDDLDRALAELSMKYVMRIYAVLGAAFTKQAHRYPELKQAAQASKSRSSATGRANNEQNALLSVSLAHLDSEAEMRRFFGAKVVCSSQVVQLQMYADCSVLD